MIYFTYRPMQVKDVEPCFSILREKFIFDAKAKMDLLAIWRLLIKEEATGAVVVEARHLPASRRQVACGFSYFLTNDFMREAKTQLPPFAVLGMIQKWRKGVRPFLLRKELDKANLGEGSNLFAPHYGWDDQRLSPEEVFKVRSLLQECFMATHAGHRVKEFMNEAYGRELLDLMLNAGVKLRRDYKEFAGTSHLKGIAEKDHPYLLGCTPKEAWEQPGSFMALFWSRMTFPRFRFKPGERKTLERALLGETDVEMSASLRISQWTVKKRWQGIYNKVMEVDSDLLTDFPDPNGSEQGQAKHKRRHLLGYLRHHPEELKLTSASQRK